MLLFDCICFWFQRLSFNQSCASHHNDEKPISTSLPRVLSNSASVTGMVGIPQLTSKGLSGCQQGFLSSKTRTSTSDSLLFPLGCHGSSDCTILRLSNYQQAGACQFYCSSSSLLCRLFPMTLAETGHWLRFFQQAPILCKLNDTAILSFPFEGPDIATGVTAFIC